MFASSDIPVKAPVSMNLFNVFIDIWILSDVPKATDLMGKRRPCVLCWTELCLSRPPKSLKYDVSIQTACTAIRSPSCCHQNMFIFTFYFQHHQTSFTFTQLLDQFLTSSWQCILRNRLPFIDHFWFHPTSWPVPDLILTVQCVLTPHKYEPIYFKLKVKEYLQR